jgi:uncharacterized membrane protein (UPF0127 family)
MISVRSLAVNVDDRGKALPPAQQLVTADVHERVVCERCVVADKLHTRMRGLLGRDELPAGEGLLLRPAPSVHTCFMRFPIDVVFLDSGLRVLAVTPDMAPWSFAGKRCTRAVLELAAGEARRRGIKEGLVLRLAQAGSNSHGV